MSLQVQVDLLEAANSAELVAADFNTDCNTDFNTLYLPDANQSGLVLGCLSEARFFSRFSIRFSIFFSNSLCDSSVDSSVDCPIDSLLDSSQWSPNSRTVTTKVIACLQSVCQVQKYAGWRYSLSDQAADSISRWLSKFLKFKRRPNVWHFA